MNNPNGEHVARALPSETENERLLRRMIALDGMPGLRCPFNIGIEPCSSPIHITATLLRRTPRSSKPGLTTEFYCEAGHRFQLNFVDHSGGVWIGLVELPGATNDGDGTEVAE